MKGETMQNIDKTETTATPRRRTMWIGLGVVIVLAASVGLWFGLRNSSRPKPRQHPPMASMADMPSPANDDSVDSTTPDAALQVDLGPDDLKKAQIQTVHVDMRETGSTLRVPGACHASGRWCHQTGSCGARRPCAARPADGSSLQQRPR